VQAQSRVCHRHGVCSHLQVLLARWKSLRRFPAKARISLSERTAGAPVCTLENVRFSAAGRAASRPRYLMDSTATETVLLGRKDCSAIDGACNRVGGRYLHGSRAIPGRPQLADRECGKAATSDARAACLSGRQRAEKKKK